MENENNRKMLKEPSAQAENCERGLMDVQERSRFATQVGHEVQDEVERDTGQDLGGQITYHGRNGFCERVIHRHTFMLLDWNKQSIFTQADQKSLGLPMGRCSYNCKISRLDWKAFMRMAKKSKEPRL